MIASQQGRTSARSDLEILEAYRTLRHRNPDKQVTGSKLRTYFGGVGHVHTYKAALDRLSLSGALDSSNETDALVDKIYKDSISTAKTLRQFASLEFEKEKSELMLSHKKSQASLELEKQKLQEKLDEQSKELKTVGIQRQVLIDENKKLESDLGALREKNERINASLMKSTNEAAALKEKLHHAATQRDHFLDELSSLQNQEHDLIKRQSDDHSRAMAALRHELTDSRQQLAIANNEKTAQASQCARLAEQLKNSDRKILDLEGAPEKRRLQREIQQVRSDLDQSQKSIQLLLQADRAALPIVIDRNNEALTVFYANRLMRYLCPEHDNCDPSSFSEFDIKGPIIVGENLLFTASAVSIPLADFEELEL